MDPKEEKLTEIRNLIYEIREVNKEFEKLDEARNEIFELQTLFVQKLDEGFNQKYTDKDLKIFDLKGLRRRKNILESLKLKYANDKDLVEYLQNTEDRINKGAKLLSVFSEGIKKTDRMIKDNQIKLVKIGDERDRFVDSIIKEYNEKTEDLRNDVKKRKIEDVHKNASIPASSKKCNNEHIHADPSSTLLSGQSLFTSFSYLPENPDDPYWGNIPNASGNYGRGRGRGRGGTKGRGRGRGRRKKE